MIRFGYGVGFGVDVKLQVVGVVVSLDGYCVFVMNYYNDLVSFFDFDGGVVFVEQDFWFGKIDFVQCGVLGGENLFVVVWIDVIYVWVLVLCD